jgi:predicted nuclease of predicted toxin-antitoxin system
MKLLLDESLPRRLRDHFPGHDVATVQECGWSGTTNGKSLRLAEPDYEAFLTADQNLQYQQNLTDFAIAVLALSAKSTRLQDLEPLIPQILEALLEVRSGEVRRIAL